MRSHGHGGKLQRNLGDAVAVMLTQRNVEEAVREVGISVATLMRWQKLPELQALFREGRRTVYSQAVARLQQDTSAAAATVLKTMIDGATPASVKMRAAEAIFNHAAKPMEIEDIEAPCRPWKPRRERKDRGNETDAAVPPGAMETAPALGAAQYFRYGWLPPLTADFAGECHVAIVPREATRTPLVEWCGF